MCMYFSTSMNKHCGCPVIYLGNSICEFVKEVKVIEKCTNFYFGTEKLPPKF